MKTCLAVDLVLCGASLLGLSILAHHLSPHGVTMTLWVGIMGGASAGLLGALGLRGYSVRRWAIGAMTVLSIVLLTQAVFGWLAIKPSVQATKYVALILTLLSVFAIRQLVNLIQNRNSLPFEG